MSGIGPRCLLVLKCSTEINTTDPPPAPACAYFDGGNFDRVWRAAVDGNMVRRVYIVRPSFASCPMG